jgi:hypothetical protein
MCIYTLQQVKGDSNTVFLSQNNTNRVSSINARQLKQIVVKYITILQVKQSCYRSGVAQRVPGI